MRLFELAGSMVDRGPVKALMSLATGKLLPTKIKYNPHSNGPQHDAHHPERPPWVYPNSRINMASLSMYKLPQILYQQQLRHYSQMRDAPRGPPVYPFPNFDDVKRVTPASSNSRSGRTFTYAMVGATGILGAMGAKSTVMDLLASLSAAGTVLALAQIEVDLSSVPEGKNIVVKWRGKPIFIRHRTSEEIAEAEGVGVGELRDPQTDAERVIKPEWLVMVGICTHLGCVPLGESGDYGGWYCPCHGSHYDISGRVRKGPAPLNMEIPKYSFIDDLKIIIG